MVEERGCCARIKGVKLYTETLAGWAEAFLQLKYTKQNRQKKNHHISAAHHYPGSDFINQPSKDHLCLIGHREQLFVIGLIYA